MFGSVQPSPAALIRAAFDLSNLARHKKSAIPIGMTDFLELLARFELATRLHEIADFMEPLRPHD